ncbi:MAG: type II secretion system F family protein [Inquilinaceae bacterium]
MNLLDHLPAGLSPEEAIVALAGLAAALVVFAVGYTLVPQRPMAGRARALVRHRDALKQAALAPGRRRKNEAAGNLMQMVVKRLDLMRSRQADTIAMKLAGAGYRSKEAAIAYLFFKATLPLAIAAAAILLLFVVRIVDQSMSVRALIALAAILIGAYAPDILIRNATQKRRHKIRKALPDALDLMVICAEAGLSLDAALTRVARELEHSYPEISDEFALTAVELGFLPDRKTALDNLAARTGLPGIRAMVGTLQQTEKFGTPLAQALRVLAAELRNERMMRAEEKAARLPAVLTVPMIVFILPPLFIVLIGPAILRVIDSLGAM